MDKPKCPQCGSDNVVPILYGMTTPEMAAKAASGEARIGAYAVGREHPGWACNDCGNTW